MDEVELERVARFTVVWVMLRAVALFTLYNLCSMVARTVFPRKRSVASEALDAGRLSAPPCVSRVDSCTSPVVCLAEILPAECVAGVPHPPIDVSIPPASCDVLCNLGQKDFGGLEKPALDHFQAAIVPAAVPSPWSFAVVCQPAATTLSTEATPAEARSPGSKRPCESPPAPASADSSLELRRVRRRIDLPDQSQLLEVMDVTTPSQPLPKKEGGGHVAVTSRSDFPLHEAARLGDLEAVFRIVAAGKVGVASRDGKGVTPVHVAVREGHRTVAEALLGVGQALEQNDCVDADGMSPLLLAAQRGWEEVVRTLLSAGADPNGPNGKAAESTMTPLYYAVQGQHPGIVQAIIDATEVIRPGELAMFELEEDLAGLASVPSDPVMQEA